MEVYIRKPIQVYAEQWCGVDDHMEGLESIVKEGDLVSANFIPCPYCGNDKRVSHAIATTVNGFVKVCPGDYIVKDTDCNIIEICKPDFFEKSYELLDGGR